jgi:hypothetical protein
MAASSRLSISISSPAAQTPVAPASPPAYMGAAWALMAAMLSITTVLSAISRARTSVP